MKLLDDNPALRRSRMFAKIFLKNFQPVFCRRHRIKSLDSIGISTPHRVVRFPKKLESPAAFVAWKKLLV